MVDDAEEHRLLNAGVDLTGAAAGGFVGYLVGGPAGALGGALTTTGVVWAVKEFASRFLSRREEVRVGGVVLFAAQHLDELLREGATLRDDGFFDDDHLGRNRGREVAEGVLLAARSAFEERKVRHLGRLLANVAVHPEVDAELASYMLGLAERMTWRQYVLIEAVARQADGGQALPSGEVSDAAGDWGPFGARSELSRLFEDGFFVGPEKVTERVKLKLINTTMSEWRLTNRGYLLRAMLALDEIDDADVDAAINALRPADPN